MGRRGNAVGSNLGCQCARQMTYQLYYVSDLLLSWASDHVLIFLGAFSLQVSCLWPPIHEAIPKVLIPHSLFLGDFLLLWQKFLLIMLFLVLIVLIRPTYISGSFDQTYISLYYLTTIFFLLFLKALRRAQNSRPVLSCFSLLLFPFTPKALAHQSLTNLFGLTPFPNKKFLLSAHLETFLFRKWTKCTPTPNSSWGSFSYSELLHGGWYQTIWETLFQILFPSL